MQEVFEKIIGQLESKAFERYGNKGMGGQMVIDCDDAIEIVRQASGCNNGWIPCSSGKLPEAGDEFYPLCWVTLENGETCIGVYRHDNKKWYTKKTEGETEYTTERHVIAWQTLPGSYQPTEKVDTQNTLV